MRDTNTHRFLLDQNFPKPVFDVESLDARVKYVHLHDFDPKLAQQTTPDWMIYLVAEQAEFAGVVTRDRSQLDQDEELVVLSRRKLSIVTWRRGVEDAVAEWGQLLAYMPQVVRLIQRQGPGIFLLPAPRLDTGGVEQADAIARRRAAARRMSYPELRASAIDVMSRYLAGHGREGLQVFPRS